MKIARVVDIEPDSHDTATYWLELTDAAERDAYVFDAGQINMLYVWGLGAVPISVSSDPAAPSRLAHTVRVAGSVTGAFPRLLPGDEVGLDGPFGRPWPVSSAFGADLLIVAGGLGLPPLRSAVYAALGARARFGSLTLLVAPGRRATSSSVGSSTPGAGRETSTSSSRSTVRLTAGRTGRGWSPPFSTAPSPTRGPRPPWSAGPSR